MMSALLVGWVARQGGLLLPCMQARSSISTSGKDNTSLGNALTLKDARLVPGCVDMDKELHWLDLMIKCRSGWNT